MQEHHCTSTPASVNSSQPLSLTDRCLISLRQHGLASIILEWLSVFLCIIGRALVCTTIESSYSSYSSTFAVSPGLGEACKKKLWAYSPFTLALWIDPARTVV